MRTREDAGRPGALGRVWTAWRVALGGLWLAVRALAARAGLTLALIALTAFAVGVAAAGAMYLRAAGESLLQDRLAATSPFSAGLLVERKVATSTEVERLRQLLQHDSRLAVPALTPPLFGLESEGFLTYSRPGDSHGPRARIAAREGLCEHLRLRAGRCPAAGAQDQPMQAAVSPRMARRLGLRPGSRLEATLRGEAVAPGLVVTGIYEPTPADPWWGLRAFFPPPPGPGAGSDPPIDAVLVDHTALLRELDRSLARSLSVSAERALDPGRVRLSNATAMVGAVTQFRREAWASAGGTRVESRLHSLVDQAGLDRRALTTPVLLATVQLDALAMLMLLVVARMAADARAGEIALAKLRGASSRRSFWPPTSSRWSPSWRSRWDSRSAGAGRPRSPACSFGPGCRSRSPCPRWASPPSSAWPRSLLRRSRARDRCASACSGSGAAGARHRTRGTGLCWSWSCLPSRPWGW